MNKYKHFESAAIHGGFTNGVDTETGSVNVPIYQTSTFRQSGLGINTGWEYSRSGNPTRAALETLMAELEGGAVGLACATGMAAIDTVLHLFSAGDTVLTGDNVYGGTYRILNNVYKQLGISAYAVDVSDFERLEKAFIPEVKSIIVESLTNPLLAMCDIEKISEIAHRHGALVIVDNTFLTPYLQKPLELGADIVVHSATKYLGGHSDIMGGVIISKTAELGERLHYYQNSVGNVLQPFDSFLLVRSIKTLPVRMERHVENAKVMADALRSHPAVEKVFYPGTCGIVTFELKKGMDVGIFFKSLNLITLAESLGGIESLVCHPASMTHASIPKEIREPLGITERLIRLSVGIEHSDDILEDLTQAADTAKRYSEGDTYVI